MKKKLNRFLVVAVLYLMCVQAFSVCAALAASSSVTLEINYGIYEEDALPVGKVGYSYKVFDYAAKDKNGNDVSDVSVYVYAPGDTLLPVKDGRFETDAVGEYKIMYVAKQADAVDTKTVTITVSDEERILSYVFNDETSDQAFTGEQFFVYDGTHGGGIGQIDVETTVTLGETDIELFGADGGYYFVPQRSGDYILQYSLTDFVGQKKVFPKTIGISDKNSPILGNPSVQKAVKLGNEINFPLIDGILYDGEEKYYLPVKVYFDETDVTKEMKYVPESVGSYTVKYVCENPFGTLQREELTFDVEVLENNYDELEFNNHFSLNNFESVSSPEDDSFVLVTNAVGTASFAFNSALPAQFLSIGLRGDPSASDYRNAKLILVDSKNFNDRTEVELGKFDAYGSFYAKYNQEKYTIVDTDEKTIAELKYYVDGRKFEGFKSGKAYLTVELSEVKGETRLELDSIGAQNVTTAKTDFGAPMFLNNDKYSSIIVSYLNNTIHLPAMKAYDLLDSSVRVTVRITAPDRSEVYFGEINEPYMLKTDKYGTYNIRYTAVDSHGNETAIVCSVYSVDMIPPTIEVGQMPREVKVGESVVLPKMTPTDNNTNADKLLVYIYVYRGNNIRELTNGVSYTFKEQGEYKIRYVVYDEFQNYTIAEFTVVCK